jgi:hypothetical protein
VVARRQRQPPVPVLDEHRDRANGVAVVHLPEVGRPAASGPGVTGASERGSAVDASWYSRTRVRRDSDRASSSVKRARSSPSSAPSA